MLSTGLMLNPGLLLDQPEPLALLDEHGWGSWDDLSVATAAMGQQPVAGAPTAAAGGAAAAMPATDPKLEKRRAQNRAAMQRWRQRQRQEMEERQQQCEELASQLERARLEHEAAASANRQLEARHSLREDWLAVLRQLGEAQQAETAAVPAAAAAISGQPAACAIVGSSSSSSAEAAPSASSGGGEPSTEVLELAAWLEGAASSSGRTDASGRYVPTLSAAMAASLRASPAVVASLRTLSFAQLLQLCDSVLARTADLLARVEATGCKAAERQLNDFMVEACLFMDLLCLLRPAFLNHFILERGGAPSAGSGDVHAFYREAVATLGLSPGQRRGLIAEWRAFQAREKELSGTVNAAAASAAAAAAATVPPRGAADVQPAGAAGPAADVAAAAAAAAAAQGAEAAPAPSMAAQAEQCMLLAQRAGALAAAAEAHWAALLTFHDFSWYSLTPMQAARLVTACRGLPDPIQLAMAVEWAEAEAAGGGRGEANCIQPPQPSAQPAEGGGDGSECETAVAIRSWQQQAAAPCGEFSATLLKLTGPQ